MRKSLLLPLLFACLAGPAFADDDDAAVLKDRKAQESYAIGAQTARTLRKDHVEVDVELLVRGLRDGFGDDRLLMSEQDLKAVMSRVQQDVHKNMVIDRRAEADRNRVEGQQWLAEHAKQPGVQVTASGLQYRVLKAGTGPKPLPNSTVMVNYRGTLPNGSEFESSIAGKPSQMFVMQTIAGMREALQMMPVGSHWQLAVPAQLAYGERGTGTEIGPNQVVLFDVDLLGIKQTTNATP